MTKIEWTDETWNAIVGCTIVSPGCTNCYAMKMAARIEAMSGEKDTHYEGTTKHVNGNAVWTGKMAQAPDSVLTKPLRWTRPRMIFVNSMSDLFHESVPDEWIDRVFTVMAASPQHNFQVLTKRSKRMREYLSNKRLRDRIIHQAALHFPITMGVERRLGFLPLPLPNVWLGVSTERQKEAEERIPDLLATPAAIRFVSAEPLLERIDFARLDVPEYGYLNALTAGYFVDARPPRRGLDWIIVGGESGPGARPFPVTAARDIIEQCGAADVPVFIKQMGAKPVFGTIPVRLKHSKGADPSEWPIDLDVRQMPHKAQRTEAA